MLSKKSHISFSELKIHSECTWRHKLEYIDGLRTYEQNPYASFGNIVHESIENYLLGTPINIEECYKKLEVVWDKEGFDSQGYIDKVTAQRRESNLKYTHEPLSKWKTYANNILTTFPEWLDETFPDWEFHQAEEELYEKINKDINFKGFIDAVISVPKKGKKDDRVIWIIDWKTTGPMGWWRDKRRDFVSHSQIGLYKIYWAKKYGIDLKDIRTGFVFLKRKNKPGNCLELFKVSSGPKFIEKSNKLVSNMLHNINKSVYIKNRLSCQFCPFKKTKHCL